MEGLLFSEQEWRKSRLKGEMVAMGEGKEGKEGGETAVEKQNK